MKEGVEILKTTYETIFEDEKSFKKKELFNQIIQAFAETGVYSEIERMYHNLIKRDPSADNHQVPFLSTLERNDHLGGNPHPTLGQKSREGNVRTLQPVTHFSCSIPNWLESDEC